jgi:hypothetical protein
MKDCHDVKTPHNGPLRRYCETRHEEGIFALFHIIWAEYIGTMWKSAEFLMFRRQQGSSKRQQYASFFTEPSQKTKTKVIKGI